MSSAPTGDMSTRLQHHLGEILADGAPAGVLGALLDGRTVLAAHGDPPPAADTPFEIGSVTKTFTALLLAELARTGDVHLQDPIRAHLPARAVPTDFHAASITLQQLATHCSGLPPYPPNVDIPTDPLQLENPFANYHLEDLYQHIADTQLTAAPGTQVQYSNFAVGLLAQLLANAVGQDYLDLVHERDADPLVD